MYDLLPLYVDNSCSDESKELVQEHIQSCQSCREKYETMASDMLDEDMQLPVAKLSEQSTKNKIAAIKVLKRIKRRWMFSTLAVLILIPFIWLGINQYRGQGISYTNIYDHYHAVKFLQALENQDYEKAYSYLNIRYYYEEELRDMLSSYEGELSIDDFPIKMEIDGINYYVSGTTKVSEDYITTHNNWLSKHKQITYEEFYESSRYNFINNMKEWEKLGYEITGFTWNFTVHDNFNEHEINELSFTIHISNGVFTTKQGELRLEGNNKGHFIVSKLSHSEDDIRGDSLIKALSIW